MAERIKSYCCIDCIHLQKGNPHISGEMAMYECSAQRNRGKVVGWVQKENPKRGLKWQGCSEYNKLHSGDMFDIKSRFSNKHKRYLYCGKKGGNRILLSIPDRVYTPVPNDYFRGQTGKILNNIRMLMQTEEQKELHRKIAKEIMKKPYE